MANLIITKPIPNYQYLHYSFGENLIDKGNYRWRRI